MIFLFFTTSLGPLEPELARFKDFLKKLATFEKLNFAYQLSNRASHINSFQPTLSAIILMTTSTIATNTIIKYMLIQHHDAISTSDGVYY